LTKIEPYFENGTAGRDSQKVKGEKGRRELRKALPGRLELLDPLVVGSPGVASPITALGLECAIMLLVSLTCVVLESLPRAQLRVWGSVVVGVRSFGGGTRITWCVVAP
jgi:hypothetical protein